MSSIKEQLQKKILVLDGAMGTMLQQADLTSEDFGGEVYDGCNEYLNLIRPELISFIHEQYFAAGADIVETNTFGATPIVLSEYGLQDKTIEINYAAATCAVDMRKKWSDSDWPRYVAGAMGPTTKTLSVTGGTSFNQLIDSYYLQSLGLLKGNVDVLLLETCQDTLNIKAASIGINKAFAKIGNRIPLLLSITIEPMGTMLAGQNVEALYHSVKHLQPLSIGLNCATGPEFMTDHIRTLANIANCYVSCYPNAGLPTEDGIYLETPLVLAKKLAAFAERGWLNITGGCCGTTPDHIKAIVSAMDGKKPRAIQNEQVRAISGIEVVYLGQENRPIFVGERTNVIGSRKFKELIKAGKYEDASEIARRQVKNGAQIIDICLADPDRDELVDTVELLQFITKKVKVPLMIDSTDSKVIESALTFTQGKSIINSINLEDGVDRFAEILPHLNRYGGAVIVGTIDEQGMAVDRQRKLEVAERSFRLLTEKYHLPAGDIIFDPLVFPKGTGDAQYIGSALETVESIRLIKKRLPNCATVLGISNVSFGLPAAGREVLNAVFLYECTKAGLDIAIVNTEKLERYASIPQSERELAEKLLFTKSSSDYRDFLNEFTQFYRGRKAKEKKVVANLSLTERLANYVIEGSKDGLIADLNLALKDQKPLNIINGPLMTGMDEVGRLFNDNQLIVAEVLQSAEVMKAAVNHLEPFMDKAMIQTKGKMVLATVKGDVHDIGKNLVEIILLNNGFDICNLGIKVPPADLIEAVRREQPNMIGLSGLLVKSAQQMVLTVQDLRQANIDIPILVGGAALSRKFTESKIAPEYEGFILYAKDAMTGLSLANKLVDPTKLNKMQTELEERRRNNNLANSITVEDQIKNPNSERKSDVDQSLAVHLPPDYKLSIFKNYPINNLLPYLNEQMLLGKHMGLKGKVVRMIAAGEEKAVKLKRQIDDFLQRINKEQLLKPQGIFRFFPAQSDGNKIYIYDPNNLQKKMETFNFPRQRKAPYLCLADFVKSVRSDQLDAVGFLAVTAGHGVREMAELWKETGNYLDSHMIQAIALELAEAFAERIHHIMRDRLGISDSPEMKMSERFSAKYQGIRVSFGYPACPEIEDQQKLFSLLNPEAIGITLTEEFMMEPEAAVSAMVFAHPQARYFHIT